MWYMLAVYGFSLMFSAFISLKLRESIGYGMNLNLWYRVNFEMRRNSKTKRKSMPPGKKYWEDWSVNFHFCLVFYEFGKCFVNGFVILIQFISFRWYISSYWMICFVRSKFAAQTKIRLWLNIMERILNKIISPWISVHLCQKKPFLLPQQTLSLSK